MAEINKISSYPDLPTLKETERDVSQFFPKKFQIDPKSKQIELQKSSKINKSIFLLVENKKHKKENQMLQETFSSMRNMVQFKSLFEDLASAFSSDKPLVLTVGELQRKEVYGINGVSFLGMEKGYGRYIVISPSAFESKALLLTTLSNEISETIISSKHSREIRAALDKTNSDQFKAKNWDFRDSASRQTFKNPNYYRALQEATYVSDYAKQAMHEFSQKDKATYAQTVNSFTLGKHIAVFNSKLKGIYNYSKSSYRNLNKLTTKAEAERLAVIATRATLDTTFRGTKYAGSIVFIPEEILAADGQVIYTLKVVASSDPIAKRLYP